MIKRLEGLLGTNDLSDREHEFVEKLSDTLHAGHVTLLSEKQLGWLQDLHRKHFA
jgi:NADPH-dependent curcumin reductase CurA